MASRSIRPPLKHTPFTELMPDGTQFVTNSWYDWALNLQKAIDTLRVIVGDPDGDGVVDDGGGVDDVNRLLAQEVTVFARDMLPTATGGCSALTVLEFGTTQPNVHALLFDPTTDESADFHVTLPFSWAGKSFKAYVYFTQETAAATYGVVWELAANCTGDDESIALDFDTGAIITESRVTSAGKLYITALSDAIPISSQLNRDGDLCSLRIYRRPSNTSDNLNVDAALIAVRFALTDTLLDPPPAVATEGDSCITALLHFDGSNGATTTVDSSITTKTVVIVGTATLSTTWQKFGTASLAVPNTGASTQNGARIIDHADFDWGTSNFTITCHFRRTSNTRDGIIFTVPVTSSKHLRLWVNTSGLLRVGWQEGGFQSGNISTGMTVALGTPTWVELVRRSGRGEVWMDGFLVYSVALASGTTEVIDCAGDIYVGCDNIAGTASLDGYIDEFVISDTARPEFEVFDSSDADWANVVFLTNGTAITDESSFAKTTSITGTTAVVSDEGGWAGRAYIQGAASSYLKATLGSDGSMTGDFTIEVLAAAGEFGVVFMAESAGYLYNNVFSGYGGTDLAMGSTNLSSGDRVHYAVSRVGSTIRGFRNGKLTGSQTYAGTVNLETLRFGMYVPNGNLHWIGQYGQIRVTKGVGRYTADFNIRPVPTVAYGSYDCASPGGAVEPETVSGPSASARWYESNAYTLISDRISPSPTGLNCIANFSSATDQEGIAHASSADGTNAQVTRTGKVYLEFRTGANYGNFIGVLANTGFTAGFPTTRDPFGTAGYYCIHNIDYRTRSPGLITNGTASTNATYDWDPGDTIGMAIDWDTGKMWFHKNTIWLSGDPAAGTSPTFTLPSGAFTIVAGAYVFSAGIQVVDLRARSGTTLLLPPTGFSWYA